MLKILFSLQTAIRVFEKPTTIRRPLLYATNMRDGRTRRDVASAPSPMKPYNPLFIWSLEKHPSFSLHCYTNPLPAPTRYQPSSNMPALPCLGDLASLAQAVLPCVPRCPTHLEAAGLRSDPSAVAVGLFVVPQ